MWNLSAVLAAAAADAGTGHRFENEVKIIKSKKRGKNERKRLFLKKTRRSLD
jgi:hypothetical protein